MPRMYLSPTDLGLTPVGIALSGQIAQLQASGTGAVDQQLAKASVRVDSYCKKRIGSVGATTLSAGVSAGGQQIAVASTLGFDDKEEQAVILGTGATQETAAIIPGGVVVTSWVSPYPGTLTLASPLTFSHLLGESVQGCYQEVSRSGSSANNEPYSEALLTQEAQIAQAHAPVLAQGKNLTRKVFVKQYPIQSILTIEHAYPFAPESYAPLNPKSIGVNPMAGIYTFTLGTVVIPEGLIRTTYLAGYQTVPEDIKDATAYYFADLLQVLFNLPGVLELQQGKRRQKFSDGKSRTLWAQKAAEILDDGHYVRKV